MRPIWPRSFCSALSNGSGWDTAEFSVLSTTSHAVTCGAFVVTTPLDTAMKTTRDHARNQCERHDQYSTGYFQRTGVCREHMKYIGWNPLLTLPSEPRTQRKNRCGEWFADVCRRMWSWGMWCGSWERNVCSCVGLGTIGSLYLETQSWMQILSFRFSLEKTRYLNEIKKHCNSANSFWPWLGMNLHYRKNQIKQGSPVYFQDQKKNNLQAVSKNPTLNRTLLWDPRKLAKFFPGMNSCTQRMQASLAWPEAYFVRQGRFDLMILVCLKMGGAGSHAHQVWRGKSAVYLKRRGRSPLLPEVHPDTHAPLNQ